MSIKSFCSLHNHTTFSLMDSLIKPQDLFSRAKELDYPAVGITDHGSLGAAWDALKASKASGVKLIMGCEYNFVDSVSSQIDQRIRHIILLARNHIGYKNLLHLSKKGYDNQILAFKKGIPRIDWQMLADHSEGVICLTACGNGILGQLINNKKSEQAKSQAQKLKDLFGEYLGFEVQPHNLRRQPTPYNDYEDQTFVNRTLIKWGEEMGVKIVPTCNAHYLAPEHHEAHDALLAIGAGQPVRSGQRLKYEAEMYLKSRQKVVDFFSRYYKDKAEEFCDNTLEFASWCEFPDWIDPKFTNPSGKELPDFPVEKQPDYQDFLTGYELLYKEWGDILEI